ncbi:hypothetical protein [Vibrio splendidus]|uniref:hypothetical protein n=1 Tax=Vibrio splendidus TaxID=29497 RepID=UPI001C06D86B|nr:hypothetical protein [Vibrio splendidus]
MFCFYKLCDFVDWVNVLANRRDAHLKTALLAYFDNEVQGTQLEWKTSAADWDY